MPGSHTNTNVYYMEIYSDISAKGENIILIDDVRRRLIELKYRCHTIRASEKFDKDLVSCDRRSQP